MMIIWISLLQINGINNNLDSNHEYTVQELRNKNHTGDYLIRTENQFYINNPTIPKKIEPIFTKGLKNSMLHT